MRFKGVLTLYHKHFINMVKLLKEINISYPLEYKLI